MATCANCGKENAPGIKFCPNCGRPLAATPPPPPPPAIVGKICAACGAVIPEHVKFCPKCGQLAQAPAPVPSAFPAPPGPPPKTLAVMPAPVAAPVVSAPPPTPPPPPLITGKTCAGCGAVVPEHVKFCPKCGKPVQATAPVPSAFPPPPGPPPKTSYVMPPPVAVPVPAPVVTPPPPPQIVTGKTCAGCGAVVPEHVKFCPKCGQPVQAAAPVPSAFPPAPVPAPPPAAAGAAYAPEAAPTPAAFQPPPTPPRPAKSSNLVMAVAAFIVIAALLGGVFYGYSLWRAKQPQPQPAFVTTQQTPPADTPAPPPAQPESLPPETAAATPAAATPEPVRAAPHPVAKSEPIRTPPRPVVTPAPPIERAAPQSVTVSGSAQQAVPIRQVQPVYPPLARQARISGPVRLHVLIGSDGAVRDVTLLSGNPMLAPAAIEAVRQWRYQPTARNGVPTDTITEVVVNFKLGE